MSTELVLPGISNTAVAEMQKQAASVSVAGYPPRINLLSGMSKATKQPNKKGDEGDWLLTMSAAAHVNLGTEFECCVLMSRAKAIHNDPKKLKIAYDVSSTDFKNIIALSKDPATKTEAWYGPEFLLWLPPMEEHNYGGGLVTFHCGSWSSRVAAEQLATFLQKPCKFGSIMLENKKKQTYPGPKYSIAEQVTIEDCNAWLQANSSAAEITINSFINPDAERDAVNEEVANR